LKIEILKARIRRNGLIELAGSFYRDDNSAIIKRLKEQNKQALIGIEREDSIYTILGENFTYYSTNLGIYGQITHRELLEILQNNALKTGKSGDFEFVPINEQDSIWFGNSYLMNALWNTIMFLYENSKHRK